jgi:hypothetical protein
MRELKKELWPYKVEVNHKVFINSVTEIELWLGKQFGTFKDRWTVVYQTDHTTYFYFRESKDAIIFALRWQ